MVINRVQIVVCVNILSNIAIICQFCKLSMIQIQASTNTK